jgi:ABC-type dipeptide/oligopeptide/nickel transport system ATPase component
VIAEFVQPVAVMYAGRVAEQAPVRDCSDNRCIPTRSG